MVTSEFQVSGMTCGHCEASIREEVREVAGVQQIDISAATGRLVVTAEAPIDDTQILDAVAEAGYTAERVG
ncbi:copper chaperone [Mycolicibacterium litorale]|uniref:Copper chaperone n=1 Tax=Mycolicibacterium litorale TaxID=758802 RepID=A0A6S6NZ90_9MYCO|nr:heavy-metal-associated domain-containing protein [Mycolicibacterium litorale]BCI51142.1 copper chaperone [Mycolicibacterium litorale]